ncbi:MAG: DUF6527 family protein [Gemmatimonadota bacterium]|nr:DUF6527 family protein [Gemmatimonadota bacterium]
MDPGKLYVCCRYRAVKHLCACGCGSEVNTPLHPTAWTLTCDGVSVSLSPSIGNWSEKCQSHYWITNSEVRWSRKYSRYQIRKTRKLRERDREEYFAGATTPARGRARRKVRSNTVAVRHRLARIWSWITRGH